MITTIRWTTLVDGLWVASVSDLSLRILHRIQPEAKCYAAAVFRQAANGPVTVLWEKDCVSLEAAKFQAKKAALGMAGK